MCQLQCISCTTTDFEPNQQSGRKLCPSDVSLMGGSSSTVWGTKHKDEAKQQYLRPKGHSKASIREFRLVLDPKSPGLTCSPDGLIEIPEEEGGIVEIKYPCTTAKEGSDSLYSTQSDSPYSPQSNSAYLKQSDYPYSTQSDSPCTTRSDSPYKTQSDWCYDVYRMSMSVLRPTNLVVL